MIGGFRQNMTWLHTWAGLVFCWILYFMFVTGTLGYLDLEIDRWMEETPPSVGAAPLEQSTNMAMARLQSEAEGAERWMIFPPDGRESPNLGIFWSMPRVEGSEEPIQRGNEQLDSYTGEPIAEPRRDTGGGQVLYRMHYLLHYFPGQSGYRLVGLITILMFVGMITGIVVHKKIFREFFTFRPGKGQRSWLDAHNLFSVSSLPFQLMITYSGLIFTVGLWMPMIGLASYGFDTKMAANLANELIGEVKVERTGTPGPLMNPMELVPAAEAEWGADEVSYFEILNPGDQDSRIVLHREAGILTRLGGRMVFDGATGEHLETMPPTKLPVLTFAIAMLGLHEGTFAGPFLRWLYVLSGILGTAMIATGAVHWTSKRRKKAEEGADGFGFRLVECLNIGTIVGLPVGIAAFFLANRILPVEMETRADWEIHIMFLTWLACLIYPAIRGRQHSWRDLSWLAAAAYAAVPVVNLATSEMHLGNTIAAGDWVLAGFDLTCLATAAVFAGVAVYLGKDTRKSTREATIGAAEHIPLGSS
ncbi:MAG: PepSY-associated TM helix domain-containing protein [Pseudomonadota bacterium]